MKIDDLQKLADIVEEENKNALTGLVAAVENMLFCVDRGRKILIAERDDAHILALAYHDGVLYAGGSFGVINAIDNKVVSKRHVGALASHGGVVYGAHNICLEGKSYRDISYKGSVYCIFNDFKTVEMPSLITALASHDGKLYAACVPGGVETWRKSELYDGLTGKLLEIKFPSENKGSHFEHRGKINAMASGHGTLYCAQYVYGFDPIGEVVDLFNQRIIFQEDFLDVSALALFDGRLYAASNYLWRDSSRVYSISDAFSVPDRKPLCIFPKQVTAMASIPLKLWNELASKGKSIQEAKVHK